MITGRRYRGKLSRPIPVWNGVLEHRSRIDAAIWEFLWLLDAITEERNGIGIVLGGAPVKATRIGADLSVDEKTVLRHLETLEREHYIRRRRTPYGAAIEVCNSRKFGIWGPSKRTDKNVLSEPERSDRNAPQIGQKCPLRSDNSVLYKEDAAVTQQKDAASSQPAASYKPEDSIWSFLKISPCGPVRFRPFLDSRWASRNGDRPSVVIGEAIDAWETVEGQRLRLAPQLFRALAALRRREQMITEPSPADRSEAAEKDLRERHGYVQ